MCRQISPGIALSSGIALGGCGGDILVTLGMRFIVPTGEIEEESYKFGGFSGSLSFGYVTRAK